MKFYHLAICAIILFSSCSSESNDTKSDSSNLLIGNWIYSHKYQNENYYEPTLCADNNTLEFKENSEWNADYYTQDSNENCYNDEDEYGSWSREGNSLTLFYEDMGDEGDPDIYKIIKLTENALELKLEFDSGDYHIYAYKR